MGGIRREGTDHRTRASWHIGVRIDWSRRHNVEVRSSDSSEQMQIGVVPAAIRRTAEIDSTPIVGEYHPVLLKRRQDHLVLRRNPEMSKLAFSRSRAPIGGASGSVTDEAQCDAGGVKACCVTGTVKRIAWLIAPAATSSYRTSPVKIGSPAASAEVQV